ncbi:MAG: enoyl-CoA hydratase/isomerase family protein [Spirochaetes bacterium]|nr:enoyl-CoA hydratase/isomerase family protein [Spirochaetota bacterium]
MEYRNLILKTEGAVASILLNRPEVMNALNREMVTELNDAVVALGGDKSVRALVISGSGGNFAAGADIIPMADQTPGEARAFSFNGAYNAIEELHVPVIAAISGYALGGGLELALACDLRICSSEAKLGLPEIKVGIFPGAGGTQRLPKLIGAGRAKEMIFTGIPVDAATALSFGLCNRVVQGDPLAEALNLAKMFIERPAAALAHAKRAVNFGVGRDLDAGIRYEAETWADLFCTEDQREGMRAFIEKRKPNFKGV